MGNLQRLLTLKKSDVTFGRIARAIGRRLADVPQTMAWYSSAGFPAKNRERLSKLKNIHAGKRVFIIANGPSLKQIDFSLLKNEYTIGMNRIYLMKDVNGFVPTYLACIDLKSQLLQFTEDYDNLTIPCFYSWLLRNKFSKKDNQYFIKDRLKPEFSKDIARDGHGAGKSVTYACMQLAYYMGFSEAYLIGKDHSYNTSEKAGVGIKSTGQEDNHFIKGYYKPGMNWDAPDYRSEEFSYKLARKAFEEDGRIIKDATIGGKLDVFEKVDFYSLF
ncbi:MAG TPA: 6-hydroxymethylpterin diphosphokinase MptE-like protein [Chitinophagaceae bacterium]|nr:6-hydroxymethylpterin diphosphokinase MptE-like protein [Chitinophagaceae bacterium]